MINNNEKIYLKEIVKENFIKWKILYYNKSGYNGEILIK